MQAMIEIRLLGDFNLVIGDVPVTSVKSTRLQFLLAYLLLHRDAQQSRKHVAFSFWTDKSEPQAHNNLRQAIHQIRQTLPHSERYVYADASTLYWRRDADFRLDVIEFEAAIDAANLAKSAGDKPAQESALEKALSLYRGELLPFCYDDWIIPERERLHQKYIDALEEMVHLLEKQRRYSNAIPYARQILLSDQLDENSYRTLMRLYALNGERANALLIYHRCVDILQSELGEDPDAATQEIYHRLLHHQDLSSSPTLAPEFLASPPLVGREGEWQHMIEAWESAASGGTHFILLEGEAGIGKSRLAEELLSWVRHQGYSTAGTRSYAAEGRLAYGPIVGWLRSEAVRPVLDDLANVWKSEIARLLPELLIESPEVQPPEPLKENWQRQSFYQALARAFYSIPQPLLLFIDDLQWCDPETLEWLHYLLRADPARRLLVIGAIRIEELPGNQALQEMLFALRNTERLIEIQINPLDAAETARLASHLIGYELETSSALRLFNESEGNPLFVLEMTRSGTLQKGLEVYLPTNPHPESSQEQTLESGLPPRVFAVLQARLAALSSPARQLASLAATVGRAFSFEVLAQASESSEDDLLGWLDELWQRRIVRVLDENIYDFSHDKLRQVAYSDASLTRRRILHRRVAGALEILHASDIDSVSGQLAFHFDQAGQPQRAIHYYHRAAQVAQRINANREAISLLEKALMLLRTLPEDHKRDDMELDLQTALGVSLIDTFGYGAAEVVKIYDRALALCQRLGRPPTSPILRSLAINHLARTQFRQALTYSEQLIQHADLQGDRLLTVEACYAKGVTMFWLGEFQPARDYLEKAITLYDPQDSRTHIALFSQNPRVICQSRLGFDLWCLGFPDQAIETSRLALDYAAEIAHPWSLAYAAFWNLFLLFHNRSFDLASERLPALIKLCQDQGIRHFLQETTVLRGWLRAERGEIEAGISLIREGMEHVRAGGVEFQRPFFLSLLSEQYGKKGDYETGLALISEARALVETSEERWSEAEILRRQGELLWRKSDPHAAEAAFIHALQVARSQDARMLELRAALALGRMWLEMGKACQVKELLAPIYSWFHGGLDTPDMQDVQHLLAKIESNPEN